MVRPGIASFLIDGEDYFSAICDDGSVRFGLKGCRIFQIKETDIVDRIKSCLSEDDVEVIFDELMSRSLLTDEFKYKG